MFLSLPVVAVAVAQVAEYMEAKGELAVLVEVTPMAAHNLLPLLEIPLLHPPRKATTEAKGIRAAPITAAEAVALEPLERITVVMVLLAR